MSVIEQRAALDKRIACTCGSTAVIDRSRHADDCLRGMWRDFTDALDADRGAVALVNSLYVQLGGEERIAETMGTEMLERFHTVIRGQSG